MRRLMLILGVCLLPLPASAQESDWKKEAIKYVQSLQTSTGGFLSMTPRPEIRLAPNLKATSSAVRALSYLKGEVPDAKGALKFVESCYNEAKGGFSDFPRGEPDVFTTAVGVMAVKELGAPLDKYRKPVAEYLAANAKTFDEIRIAAAGLERLEEKVPQAKAWIETLTKDRNRDGTYGSGPGLARETGSFVVTTLRLGEKAAQRDEILMGLREGQRKDGGFGKAEGDKSDLETTYRVMRCFMMLKDQPKNVGGMRGFLMKCRNADGGFAATPGEASTVSATYFAAIVDHWLAK